MKAILRVPALALILATQAACAAAPASTQTATSTAAAARATEAADLTGTWKGTFIDPQGGKHDIELQLASDGKALTGNLLGGPPDGASQPILNGSVAGDRIGFDIVFKGMQGEDVRLRFEGTVNKDRIRGVHGMARMPLDFTWDAKKV